MEFPSDPRIPSQIVLEGLAVRLRTPTEADCEALRTILNDPLTMRHLPLMSPRSAGWTLTKVKDRLRRQLEQQCEQKGVHFTVLARDAGTLLGMCGLTGVDLHARKASFGIILGSSHWRRGYGSECHGLCLSYAFEVLGLDRIEFQASPDNAAIRGLFDRLGIRLEGIQRLQPSVDVLRRETSLYVLVAKDWPRVKGAANEAVRRRFGREADRPSTPKPTGIVTLVLTDIEGSTRLLEEIGTDAYRDALGQHRAIVRRAFVRHRGYEVDCAGDAFFFAFASATDAIQAVADTLKDLRSGPVTIRIGIHTGEPGLDASGYVGMDIHQAARIMSAAHGGQALMSESTRNLVDADVTDLGEHKLKDIGEPVWLFQLGRGLFPPLRTLSNSNLPAPASSFLGREIELTQAADALRASRLVTVIGPGGIGKTRFAIELALRQLADFPNGVFWVPLAPLRDPRLVLDSARETLGAKTDLAAHIGDRRMLIVFDNFEHVAGAAPGLSHLLAACGNLKLLITSREVLRLDGERNFPLRPLENRAGVALFCERARLEPSESIRMLCRYLDNLPLGIELAAARARIFSPEQLLARIGQRLDLLKGGRDSDPRQATLRAAISWSYDLLEPAERALFARLSVFAGGCTIEAAQDVAGADPDTLASLVDKSLVQRVDGRFVMFETIRQFAGERLVESSEEGELRKRLFLRLQALVDSVDFGSWLKEWGDQLQAEHHNLRSALSAAPTPEHALRLACGLGQFWTRRGHGLEGRLYLEEALARAPKAPPKLRARGTLMVGQMCIGTDQHQRAAALLNTAHELFSALGDSSGEARTCLTQGWLAFLQRDLEKAVELQELGLAKARGAGATELVAHALGRMAALADRRGDHGRVAALENESLSLMQQIGDEEGVAICMSAMAWRAVRQRDFQKARRLAEESTVIFLRAGRMFSGANEHTLCVAMLGLAMMSDVHERAPLALRKAFDAGGMLDVAAIMELIAGMAAESGADIKAARLVGAAAGLFRRSGVMNDELHEARELYESWLTDARARLGDTEWLLQVSIGEAMRSEDAVRLALGEND